MIRLDYIQLSALIVAILELLLAMIAFWWLRHRAGQEKDKEDKVVQLGDKIDEQQIIGERRYRFKVFMEGQILDNLDQLKWR